MKRRDLLKYAPAMGLPVAERIAHGLQLPLRIRRHAASTLAQPDIITLRRGVELMKANTNALDYRSWTYWSNVHGMTDPVPPELINVWKRCQHGTSHFLTWHRAYLYFFEQVIAEVTETPSFALPYWEWYGNSAFPADWAQAQVFGLPNALYHTPRAYWPRVLLQTAMGMALFTDFQRELERNPHGTVHQIVNGSMGQVTTAARDPLFCAHHSAIDRLWHAWITQPDRTHPIDPVWLDRRFTFSADGTKSITVRELLDPQALGYCYDSLDVVPTPLTAPPAPSSTTTAASTASTTSSKSSTSSTSLSGPETLATRSPLSVPGNLTLHLPLPRNVDDSSLAVVLRNVRPTERGRAKGFDYRLYVNLPGSTGYRHDDFFVGSINSFVLGSTPRSASFLFELRELVAKLKPLGLWSQTVRLSFVSDDNDPEPLIRIDAVELDGIRKR